MLFNSYVFLLGFLPATLLGFFLFGRVSKTAGALWLAGASVFFYGWWDTRYIPLLAASICGNYWAGAYIARRPGSDKGRRGLFLAIAANLGLLAYYKYADFFISSGNAIFALQTPLQHVVLPIGISFFTFTQIAFVADAYVGKVRETRFIHYVLFVTYFPHLIAGPVLHHKEMMPQFDETSNYRPSAENFAVGVTIFAIGLAKKVLIADSLAVHVSPGFSAGAAPQTLISAWAIALAYTFQLYFDFSGYSDMAIGLSRMFGVRLPVNFNSPYKAENIADFWRRWHMTLSRFLRDYLYIPLGGNRQGPARRRLNLMLTMLLGGLWHGAGWNFVIWGGMHGTFLVLQQLWSGVTARLRVKPATTATKFFSTGLTFAAVVFAWVYFRAPDLATANRIAAGMLGAWGIALPEPVMQALGPIRGVFESVGVSTLAGGGAAFVEVWSWIACAALIAFVGPNTQELLARYRPVLESVRSRAPRALEWRPSRRFALLAGLVLAAGVLSLSRPTEFLYFQF